MSPVKPVIKLMEAVSHVKLKLQEKLMSDKELMNSQEFASISIVPNTARDVTGTH
jgi:hypothetical protein